MTTTKRTAHTLLTTALALATVGLTTAGLASGPATAAAVPTKCNGLTPDIVMAAPGFQNGTGGDDIILGTSGADFIFGLGGDDTICGLGGVDTIDGGSDADTIFGNADADSLDGGFGEDVHAH